MDNKYVNRAKISEAKFRELVRYFALDLTATQISDLSHLNRNTVNKYMKGIRERIAEYCHVVSPPELQSLRPIDSAEVSIALIGILEHGGVIAARGLCSDAAHQMRRALNEGESVDKWITLSPISHFDVIYDPITSQWVRLYDTLADKGQVRAKSNRIQGFLGYTSSRLEKFKGIKGEMLNLHLKESEFRYNHSSDDLYHLLLSIIRKHPLF